MDALIIVGALICIVACVSPLILRALEKDDRTYMVLAFILIIIGVALWLWLWMGE